MFDQPAFVLVPETGLAKLTPCIGLIGILETSIESGGVKLGLVTSSLVFVGRRRACGGELPGLRRQEADSTLARKWTGLGGNRSPRVSIDRVRAKPSI